VYLYHRVLKNSAVQRRNAALFLHSHEGTMKRVIICLSIAIASVQCGKNLSTVGPTTGITPPQNVMAYASDSQSVTLTWTAPPEASDSTFSQYVIRWNSSQDSIPKGVLVYTAKSLPPGLTQFQLFSRLLDGEMSTSPAAFSWAPAQRFSGKIFTIWEYGVAQKPTAIDLAATGGTPTTFPIDSSFQSTADFYLYGGSGAQTALQLYSADLYQGTNYQTSFSTVTSSSSTLDYPLSSFPASSTFTLHDLTVNSNTIYYLRLKGPNGPLRYARVLVTDIQPGGGPGSRSITMQVSVQQEPGVSVARRSVFAGERAMSLGTLFPLPH
jgi:hypothetical protein